MKIITVSREFGSGGRELGKRLADIMEFDYYDSEIISAVAKASGLDENYVENQLTNHGWRNIPISFRGTLASGAYANSNNIALLVQQKKVIENIAVLGKNFVIVGRNADVILKDYKPFNIFVCANMQAKIKRCMNSSHGKDYVSEKDLIKKIKHIDKMRSETREILSGSPLGQTDAYDLIINTSNYEIKQLTQATADFINRLFGRI